MKIDPTMTERMAPQTTPCQAARQAAARWTTCLCLSALMLLVVGCNVNGGRGDLTAGTGALSVPLIPESENSRRVVFPITIELLGQEQQTVVRIPVNYEFAEGDLALLKSPSVNQSAELRVLQSARITSKMSASRSGIVVLENQARSSLLPLYQGGADLALNSLSYRLSSDAFGLADNLKLNIQTYYASNKLIIGVWAEMTTERGEWLGFYPAYDKWIGVPLAEIGEARADPIIIDVPALHATFLEHVRKKQAEKPNGSIDLENIQVPAAKPQSP